MSVIAAVANPKQALAAGKPPVAAAGIVLPDVPGQGANGSSMGVQAGEQLRGLAGAFVAILSPIGLAMTPEAVQNRFGKLQLAQSEQRDTEKLRRAAREDLASRLSRAMASTDHGVGTKTKPSTEQQQRLAANSQQMSSRA